MADVTIRIEGLERISKKATPDILTPGLSLIVREAALTAQREARNEAPKDTSALARSILADIKPLSAEVSTSLAYAQAMEEGRRPGARMPPPAALAGWARRHGYGGSLFVLARAIGRRGIKGRFYMRKGADATRRALPGIVRRGAALIVRAWDG
ncbi:MAG: hypothetical protein AB7R89_25785 [Dehalococcoidia bacterium]